MGPCISNNFPCLTQFGQKLDLGTFYIQVLNYYLDILILKEMLKQNQLCNEMWTEN